MTRTAVKICKKTLIEAIEQAEKDGPCKNMSQLYEKVSDIYNDSDNADISKTLVSCRIKEWDLDIQTKPTKRGRSRVEINRPLFEKVVAEVEENGPLENRNALSKAVAKAYNLQSDDQITSSVVILRLTEFGIEVKTPKGQRGGGIYAKIDKEIKVNDLQMDEVLEQLREAKQTFMCSPTTDGYSIKFSSNFDLNLED